MRSQLMKISLPGVSAQKMVGYMDIYKYKVAIEMNGKL